MARLSRKELKKDEVRATFAHTAEAVLAHQKLTIYLVAVALVIAAVVVGGIAYSQRQTANASKAYTEAMNTYNAPVGPAQQPNQLTYASDNAKLTIAAQKFADVAAKYSRTQPGKLALYFEALSLEKLDKYSDAQKLLRGISHSSDETVSAMSQFELAQVDDHLGNADDAAALYEQLLAKPTVVVPKPMVMLYLAEHYSQKNPAQAAKLFQEIKSGYPDTPLAQQADQELAVLPNKS